MSPPRLSLEQLNGVALAYVFFKDRLRDIAAKYKIKQGTIPHYIRRAVKEGLITTEQHRDIAKKREFAGRFRPVYDVELELKLIRAGKDIEEIIHEEIRGEKPELITNRQIAKILYCQYDINFAGRIPSRSYVSNFLKHYADSKTRKKREKMLKSGGEYCILFQTPEQNSLNGKKGAEVTNNMRFSRISGFI